MHWSDIIGWFGFAVILISYLMVALQRWRIRSFPNQIGNIIGPCFLGINSLYHYAWPLVVLNAVWLAIAISTVAQILIKNDD